MTDMALGYTAQIADEIISLRHPLTDATPHPRNVRRHRLEKIAQSLMEHGQRYPIVVQKSTGYIVKGNGTYEAAKMLGWDSLAMLFQEISDDDAARYMLNDNRASDLSSYDRKRLHEELQGLGEEGRGKTLWDQEEFEDLDEEFTGITLLPPRDVNGADPASDGAVVGTGAGYDLSKKLREIPLVYGPEEYQRMAGYVLLAGTTFGMSKKADVILEGMSIVARLINEGVIRGRVSEAPVPEPEVEGQVGMEEAIAAAEAEAKPAQQDFPF